MNELQNGVSYDLVLPLRTSVLILAAQESSGPGDVPLPQTFPLVYILE